MAELTKWTTEKTYSRANQPSISLIDGEQDRIVSLSIDDGAVVFLEECDGYFSVRMSIDDAKTALKEALAWLDEQS